MASSIPSALFPTIPINETNNSYCKDVPLNPTTNTSLRIFLPRSKVVPNPDEKLPLVVFFHGGGFVRHSVSSQPFHDTCIDFADRVSVVILSVEYRLAPDNRLPAAYDDGVDAVKWVRDQASDTGNCKTWMREYVDFSQCYLMGSSSGANMVYHVGLRCVEVDLSPVKIRGLVLSEPFFGGVQRTESELRFKDNQTLPLVLTDQMWALSLPIGADRDHEFSNPMLAKSNGEKIRRLPRCLVRGHENDLLIDKQKEFTKMLKEHEVEVVTRFREGGYHGVEMFEPTRYLTLCEDIKEFVYGASSPSEEASIGAK